MRLRPFVLAFLALPGLIITLAACAPPEPPPAAKEPEAAKTPTELVQPRPTPVDTSESGTAPVQPLPGGSDAVGAPVDPKSLPPTTKTSPPNPTQAPPPQTGAPCSKAECGPAMGMPNTLCPDGKTVSGPKCGRNAEGKCGFTITKCP